MTLKVKRSMSLEHATGPLKWGHGQTEGYLFASTDPAGKDDDSGCHKMFDIDSGRMISSFGIDDGGDAMAIDPLGVSSMFSSIITFLFLCP